MTPYEIIIICSIGGVFCGCLVIWGCEKICCRHSRLIDSLCFDYFGCFGCFGFGCFKCVDCGVNDKNRREPLLNLLEDGFAKVSTADDGSFSSATSSGSETTSIYRMHV